MCNPSFSLSTSSSFEPISSSSSSSSSSSYSNNYFRNQRFRKPSLRSMAGLGTTPQKQRSSLFSADENSDHEEPHYFLDSCFRCKTPLHADDDIYMYRGDTPFCTEECRQEQIEIDEAQERKNKSKMSKKNLKTKIDKTSSKSQSHEIHVRAAETTVLAS